MKQKEFLELVIQLMESGMPAGKLLASLENEHGTRKYSEQICLYIEENSSFSLSLLMVLDQMHGKRNLVKRYKELVEASEETGNLTGALKCILRYLNEREETLLKCFTALLYPFFVVALTLLACFLLFEKGRPYLSQLGITDIADLKKGFSTSNAMLVLLVCVTFTISVRLWQTDRFQCAFFESLYDLTKNGIPLEKSVMLASSGLKWGKRKALLILEQIRTGNSFTDTCRESGLFDSLTDSWLCYGEETGENAEAFLAISKHYSSRQNQRKEYLLHLMEPLGNGIAGIYIMAVMITVALPMLKNLIGAI